MKQTNKGASPGSKTKRPKQAVSLAPPFEKKKLMKKTKDVSMTPDTFERSQSRIKKKAVRRRSVNDTYINDNKKFGNVTQLDLSQNESMMEVDYDETPATLSQISAINPLDNDTLTTTFASKKRKRKSAIANETWEMAVECARGEPDGAERSFTRKALSKINLNDEDDESGDDSPEEEGFSEEESSSPKKSKIQTEKRSSKDKEKSPKKSPKLKEKKSTAKIPLKQATKTLKSLKQTIKKDKKGGEKDEKNFKALPDETTVPKTPNQTRKEKKKERKMVKNNYELISSAKKVWEDLRRSDTGPEKRKRICDELMKLVVTKVKELSVVHDSSRVVQCLVQYGTEAQRETVFSEIKDDVPELLKSKYAKYVLRKLIHYGSKDLKAEIIQRFRGHVRQLIKHKEASELIEYAYNEFATAPQRNSLLEEFYGPSFVLFQDQTHRTLEQIMTESPEKKEMVLKNMKEVIQSVTNKELLLHSIVHKLIIDFLTYADDKMKKEVIESLREHVLHLLHTRDGSRVAMHCVWGGTTKDRKLMIKSLKTHVLKICKEEHGYLFLLAIFDSVDDTVLVQKVILDEIIKHLADVVSDQYGKKVLLYLLCPRDPTYFQPDIVKVLSKGDSNSNSKKDKAVRSKELKVHISPPMLKYLEENTESLMTNTNSALFVKSIMTHALGDARLAMIAIADFVAKSSNDGDLGMVENPAWHISMKKIISHDKVRMEAGEGVLFSSVLLEALPKSAIKMWAASNRGCFMLICLLDVGCPTVTEKVIDELKTIRKSLGKMTFKGAELLLEKLDSLASGMKKEFRV